MSYLIEKKPILSLEIVSNFILKLFPCSFILSGILSKYFLKIKNVSLHHRPVLNTFRTHISIFFMIQRIIIMISFFISRETILSFGDLKILFVCSFFMECKGVATVFTSSINYLIGIIEHLCLIRFQDLSFLILPFDFYYIKDQKKITHPYLLQVFWLVIIYLIIFSLENSCIFAINQDSLMVIDFYIVLIFKWVEVFILITDLILALIFYQLFL